MAVTKIPSKIPGSGPRSETSPKSNQLVLVIHYIPSLQKNDKIRPQLFESSCRQIGRQTNRKSENNHHQPWRR